MILKSALVLLCPMYSIQVSTYLLVTPRCEEVNRVYDVSAPGPNGHIPIRVYDSRSKVSPVGFRTQVDMPDAFDHD